MATTPLRAFLLPFLFVGLAVSGAMADSLEDRAQRLEGKLMAPCCRANTVAMHESPASQEAKEEIRKMLAEGATDREILDAFVARFGDQILSAPRAEGFNLVAWIGPFLALTIGLLVMGLAMRTWVRKSRNLDEPLTAPAGGPAEIPADYARRLQDELDRMDD